MHLLIDFFENNSIVLISRMTMQVVQPYIQSAPAVFHPVDLFLHTLQKLLYNKNLYVVLLQTSGWV